MSINPAQWKWLLAIIGLLIVLGSAISAGYLVRMLSLEENLKAKQWLLAQRYLTEMSDAEAEICDLTIYTEVLQSNSTIPLILVNSENEIISFANFGSETDTAKVVRTLAELQATGVEPVEGGGNRIYVLESRLLRALRYFPFIQLLLIGSFIMLGYFSLSAIRKSEQNGVWVGMAKETAHQLGTPISAIMAWIEYLRVEYEDNEELAGVADELTRDVDRLQLVAERFNKIGSTPELSPIATGEILEEVFDYMSKRAPRKVDFTVEMTPEAATAQVAVNRHLFEWVLENLIRNSLDAMDGEGKLQLKASLQKEAVEIEVVDTGKGIPQSKRKAVFKPGYTTKSRGWGLGLSLAKRIVADYHGGRIFVKDSVVGKGSTFAVRLPLAK